MALEFTDGELVAMRAAQVAHYHHAGKVGTRSAETVDAGGQPVVEYEWSDEMDCGFAAGGSRIIRKDTAEPIVSDAVARLPYDTAVVAGDAFELTKAFGSDLDPTQTFIVSGEVASGPSGIVVQLQRVLP